MTHQREEGRTMLNHDQISPILFRIGFSDRVFRNMMDNLDNLSIGTSKDRKFVAEIVGNLMAFFLIGPSGWIPDFKIEAMLPECLMGKRT